MTLAAEVQELDGEGHVQPLARLVVTGEAEPAVVELAPGGSAIAATLLDPALRDPAGRLVAPADGAEYLRVLRYAKSSDRLWVTPLAELPEQEALDPATPFPDLAEPYVPATLPYPTPPVELDWRAHGRGGGAARGRPAQARGGVTRRLGAGGGRLPRAA